MKEHGTLIYCVLNCMIIKPMCHNLIACGLWYIPGHTKGISLQIQRLSLVMAMFVEMGHVSLELAVME